MASRAKVSGNPTSTTSGSAARSSSHKNTNASQTGSGATSATFSTAVSGLAVPLINGRSSNGLGPDVDLTEPLDQMQTVVQSLGSGDFVYLAAWFFEPSTVLTAGAYNGAVTWGDLLAKKAAEGVKIRILINDFDRISGLDQWLQANSLDPLNAVINAMAPGDRDNLKYMVQMHAAHVGKLKSLIAGQGWRNIYVASYHEKFMVAWRSTDSTMVAFCGGLDIESRKTPARWSYAGLAGWHDIHVKLEGPITRDIEQAFVTRWNAARDSNTRTLLPDWKPMEELIPTPLSAADDAAPKKIHKLQAVRTVSQDGALSIYSTKQSGVKGAYQKAIQGAKSFIYMENQYFRDTDLGQWIAKHGKANPNLVVIMVVVASAAADDGANVITEHGNYLQFTTFDLIMKELGARARIYTMVRRAVHSKFMLVDDQWMTIGSANANTRSFELDTELNVAIDDPSLTKDFRVRLWAHNLGKPLSDPRSWAPADFLTQWDQVADANGLLLATPQDMAGEGIIRMDYTKVRGKKHLSIPDALAKYDATPEDPRFAGMVLPHGHKVA